MRKRTFGTTVAAVLAAVVLSACSTGGAAPTPTATTPSAAPLTGTVTVFAAASLTETFDALAASFEKEHPGVKVALNYGGSSGLAEQIVSGAPADVFAAANTSTMDTVQQAGLAVDPRPFATNILTLIVPTDNPGGVTGLADLARPELAVALCDVAVPCGSASQKLLADAGVTPAPDTLEQDVKAVVTKVSLGEADAGLVYVTDATAAGGDVTAISVPNADVATNVYPITVLADAPNAAAASAWVAYVRGPSGQKVLADAGFGTP